MFPLLHSIVKVLYDLGFQSEKVTHFNGKLWFVASWYLQIYNLTIRGITLIAVEEADWLNLCIDLGIHVSDYNWSEAKQ